MKNALMALAIVRSVPSSLLAMDNQLRIASGQADATPTLGSPLGSDNIQPERGALSTRAAIPGAMATYSAKVIFWEDAIASNLQHPTDAQSWDAEAPILTDEHVGHPVAIPGVTQVLSSHGM